MKYLPAFICVAIMASACSSSPSTPARDAVSGYLKRTLDDPASYEPVRWGRETAYLRAQQEREIFDGMMAGAKQQQDTLISYIEGEYGAPVIAQQKARVNRLLASTDSVAKIVDGLERTNDTTRLGVLLSHAFRAKNKMGGLVLDSARFVVLSTGDVSVAR